MTIYDRILCKWLHFHNWNKPDKIGNLTYPVKCKRCHILNRKKLHDYDEIMELQLKIVDLLEAMKLNDERYKKLKDILDDKGENILTIYTNKHK